MDNRLKITLLIDLFREMSYRDDDQLRVFLKQARETIVGIFGPDSQYLSYLDNIRFKPASFFASESQFAKKWKKGKTQVSRLLSTMLEDPIVSHKPKTDFLDAEDETLDWKRSQFEEKLSPTDSEKIDEILRSISQTIDHFKDTVVNDISHSKDFNDLAEEDEENYQTEEGEIVEELSKQVEIFEPEKIHIPDHLPVIQDSEAFIKTGQSVVGPQRLYLVPGGNDSINVDVYKYLNSPNFHMVVADDPELNRRSVAEQFNEYSNIQFAVVIISSDYFMYRKSQDAQQAQIMANPHVIFQLGYLIAKLGRDRVVAVYEADDHMKRPTSYFDVLYIPYDQDQVWKPELVRRIKSIGLNIEKEIPAV